MCAGHGGRAMHSQGSGRRFRFRMNFVIINTMKIGYARVSTVDQNLALQRDALSQAGCERIVEDASTGAVADRPGLVRVLDILRQGDILVVWRLDRLGRSLKHLIELVGEFDRRGVGFQSLNEHIDTETPTGKLIFHMFGALAEFERGLLRERTMAGLSAARARGRLGGRPPALDAGRRELAVRLYVEGRYPVSELCRMMGISKPTLYAYVRRVVKSEEIGS